MHEGDQPPVGLILCTDKNHIHVEYATAGLSNSVFVSRYLVALPSKKKLEEFLQRDRARLEPE